MACSIKFVRLTDFTADIEVLDLSTGGYALMNEGYFQAVAPIGARSVTEVITLKLQGTSKDDLASMTQAVDEKIKQVQWWIDQPAIELYQVWIRVQLDGETYARQAQILNIKPPDKVKVFTPMEANANYIGEYQIGIERTPFWEEPVYYPTTTPILDLNAIGGMAQLSETIYGDVPARIPKLTIAPDDNSYQLDYYIGWRSDRFGAPANFAPVWSCSVGQVYDYTSDTTLTADATAYSGTRATCTFAAQTTIFKRVAWMVENVAPTFPNDQRGEFQVLLRAKMSDNTSIARVRIKFGFGFMNGSPTMAEPMNPAYRSRVVIDGSKIYTTNWSLFELGTVSIPNARIETSSSLDNFTIQLEAERVSGAGNLLLDCLILIPCAEGFIHSALDIWQLSKLDAMNIYQYADGTIYSIGRDGTAGMDIGVGTINPVKWGLPAEGSKPYVVIAAQRFGNFNQRNISVKGDIAAISYVYIPRFRTLRGNVV